MWTHPSLMLTKVYVHHIPLCFSSKCHTFPPLSPLLPFPSLSPFSPSHPPSLFFCCLLLLTHNLLFPLISHSSLPPSLPPSLSALVRCYLAMRRDREAINLARAAARHIKKPALQYYVCDSSDPICVYLCPSIVHPPLSSPCLHLRQECAVIRCTVNIEILAVFPPYTYIHTYVVCKEYVHTPCYEFSSLFLQLQGIALSQKPATTDKVSKAAD